MWNTEPASIVPTAMLDAIDHQRAAHPADREVLDRLVQRMDATRPMLSEIRDAVTEFYRVETIDLISRSRADRLVFPRQVFCYLAHHYTKHSMGNIGKLIGLRDHTTVLHSIRVIEQHMTDQPVAGNASLDQLRQMITQKVMARLVRGQA